MTMAGPALRESLEITYPLVSRACRLVRVLAEMDGETDVARRARSLGDQLQAVAVGAGVSIERRDARELLALEVRRALDVLAEANARRLAGHGALTAEDTAVLEAYVRRLLQVGEELVTAIRQLPRLDV